MDASQLSDQAPPLPPPPHVAYGTFTRRVRALVIDSAVMAGGLVLVVVLSDLIENVPGSGRILLALMAAQFFLYEPVLVWRYGGTVGHRASNLRVVSERSRGNPTLPQAFARYLIKAVLGIASFVSIALTRRHQALHDVVTRTTVQARELELADPDHFVTERELSPEVISSLPPVWRRVAVILAFGALSYVAVGVIAAVTVPSQCIDSACTRGERRLLQSLGAAWLLSLAVFVVVGWRGQLWGARRSRAAATSATP